MQNNEMTVKAAALTIFICMLFGGNPVAIKLGLTGLGAFTSAGIRFAIATLVILTWARINKTPLKLTSKQVKQTLVLAAIFVVQLSLFYHGLGKTTASHGVLISNVLPIFVLILAHFFIPKDRISIKKAISIALGFIGVVFLFLDSPDVAYDLKLGDGMVLVAVVFWAISAVRVKQIIAGYNSLQITLFPMMFAVPFFFIGGFLWDVQMIEKLDVSIITAMLYQSLVTASFGFLAWNGLLQKFGVITLHSFVFIMPLTGVLLGVLFFNEPITPCLAAAITCIVAGVMVVTLKKH
ncbi:MAG: DMT family transporter [Pseudomonadota bacterium]